MDRDTLFAELDRYLEVERFKDYCPNGIQVEGRAEVRRVALGVSISQALIEASIAWGADAIVVHHGMFWRGDPAVVRGFRRARLKRLLEADLTLAGYHLPLDAHPQVGNNAELARGLGLEDVAPFGESGGRLIGVRGRLPSPQPVAAVIEQIAALCGGAPLAFTCGPEHVSTLGIVSGGAGKMVEEAIVAGLDLYLTGEPEEPAMAIAAECGIHFVAAGHYRTETFGVIALGRELEARYGLETRFFDLPNPV